MNRFLAYGVTLCASIMAISPASAAETGLVTTRHLSDTLAYEAARAAIDACLEQQKVHVGVVIMDTTGAIKLAILSDGAMPFTVDVARRKAYTSAMRGRSTAQLQAATQSPTSGLARANASNPDILMVSGGLPIMAGNEVVGGIGVSGGVGQDGDQACAQAGIDKIKDRLK